MDQIAARNIRMSLHKVFFCFVKFFWGLMLMHTDPKSEADLDRQFVTLRTR